MLEKAANEDIGQRKERLAGLVQKVLEEARRLGASSAEAAVSSDAGLVVSVRKGEVETVEHTRDNGLGITVYFGTRRGSASTSDLGRDALIETVKAACNIARFTTEDPCAHLADPERMATSVPDLDLYHPWDLALDRAIEIARTCEDSAFACDQRISNSEGASLSSHGGLHVYGNSHGFLGGYPSSRHSLSCAVVAQDGGEMQRDYWYTVARSDADLEQPERIGTKAAERALARLGSRKIGTCTTPVVFQAEIATSLLRSLVGAVRGTALYRRASFLLDCLGQSIFPAFVRISEDPLMPKGLGSAPFDAEGVMTAPRDVIAGGVLKGYVLDTYSACKLGMHSTGNAGGVHNLSIDPGPQDLDGLLAVMDSGLLVTELMGQGTNLVTGDYSRGAAGFWVEGGKILHPVEEITIAGNLRDIFAGLIAVGSDVDRRGSFHTGSWLVDRMTVAGN